MADTDDRAPPSPAPWERRATSGGNDERAAALEEAARLPPQQAVAILPLWLNDPEASLRRHALNRLLLTADPAAALAALRCADDPDPGVRLQAVYVLARFPCAEALPVLERLAGGQDAACARIALEALLRRVPFLGLLAAAALDRTGGLEQKLNALVIFKQFPQPQLVAHVRAGVCDCIAAGHQPDPDDLARLLQHVPEEMRDELFALGGPVWLRAALICCDAAGSACTSDALRRLEIACADADPALRERAVAALARYDAAEPGTVLGRLLRHPCVDVRSRAVAALAAAGAPAAAALRRTLADDDSGVRRAAYDALALVLSEDVAAVWRRALRDPDKELRLYAVTRLEAMNDAPDSSRALVVAARDEELSIRVRAVRALISREESLPSLATACCEALKSALDFDALSDSDLPPPPARPAAPPAAAGEPSEDRPATPAEATGWTAGPPGAPLLLALIRAVARYAPPGTLGTLVAAARHRSALVRRTAAEALLRIGGTTAVVACAELASTDDPDVLRRVATVLAQARDPRGLVPVLRALEECRGAGAAMQPFLKIYPHARHLRFLLGALKSSWPSVRRYAARELNELDSPAMIDPLLEVVSDGDIEVQLAAVQALGKFADRAEVCAGLIGLLDYGDIAVREKAIKVLAEYQVHDAVEPLIRLLANPFLHFRAEEALVRIGERKGFLAIKRRKLREKLFGKKKSKGPVAPPLRKGKTGLGRAARSPR